MTYLAVHAVATKQPAWSWVPLRRVARIRRETNAGSSARLLSLSASRGVEPRPDDGGRQLPSEATVTGYWLVHADDLVFNPMWAIEGGVAVSDYVGAVSTAYRVYGLSPRIYPKFIHYWFRSSIALEQYRLLVRGITTFDRSVTREDFEGMPVPVPPLTIQRAIADFLDRQTIRIDGLIALKRRMIELLAERLQAAIDHEISDNTSERQPLGKVLALLVDRRGLTPGKLGGDFVEVGVPVVSARNVRNGRVDFSEDVRFVPQDMALKWMREPLKPGDVIVTSEAPMGAVAVVRPEELPFCIGQRLIALRPQPTTLSAEYLFWALQSREAQDQLVLMSTGSTAAGVRQRYLVTLRLPIPALELQHTIAARLDAEGKRVSLLLEKLHKQTELLQEHSQVLTTAAVTGVMTIPERVA